MRAGEQPGTIRYQDYDYVKKRLNISETICTYTCRQSRGTNGKYKCAATLKITVQKDGSTETCVSGEHQCLGAQMRGGIAAAADIHDLRALMFPEADLELEG